MVPEVTVEELHAAQADGALVVDVREPYEYAWARVPGAVLMPLRVVPLHVDELPTDQPVYVVCAVGVRSYQAAEHMRRRGVAAYSVAGGTNAWLSSGRPVESSPVESSPVESGPVESGPAR